MRAAISPGLKFLWTVVLRKSESCLSVRWEPEYEPDGTTHLLNGGESATMRPLLLGATGLVGRTALKQALAKDAISEVVAPTRRPLVPQNKLVNPVNLRLDELAPRVKSWDVGAVICALGTTKAKAGCRGYLVRVNTHFRPKSFMSIRLLSLRHPCSIQFSQRDPVAVGSLPKS